MKEQVQFRVSSFLKDLIGKELITDEFVAVFELVKNSFDANAKHVQVIFENQHNSETAKIIIRDDGKGMNEDDLKNKWLFVAYSDKRSGIEDKDYRNLIHNKRIFAGAKGVGRFSCDRLGRYLNLITIKDERYASIENLVVDWTSFEEDSKKEFVKIKVTHNTLLQTSYKKFKHGTILEISGLRDVWDRERLKKLKFSLEKLINPIQANDMSNFSIEIKAKDELLQDEKEKSQREKVNGFVHNWVFETLGLKTTEIRTEIIENGGVIKTSLIDRGRMIYTIKERNSYDLLLDINISLFVLNRAAKVNFKKKMGIDSVSYGSVFMYKNGFRIYPFGEESDDSLQIDRRKQQGYNRFLGTRDLIGRIEINGNNHKLRETTSRDGGLIKNDTYHQLIEFFYDKALKRLEKYTVDVIKFGDDRFDKETGELFKALKPEDVKNEILGIIANLTRAKNVIDIQYDINFLQLYEALQEKSASQLVKNFTRIAEQTDNPELIKQAQTVERHFKQLLQAKNEAEDEADKNREKVEQIFTENLFLRSDVGADKEILINLQHHITHASNAISILSLNAIDAVKNKNEIEALSLLNKISLENKKIATLSNFVSKAKFDTKIIKIEGDIVEFVNEYIANVYLLPSDKRNFKIEVEPTMIKRTLRFIPIEIIIIIDNLLSNSIKANASVVKVFWKNIHEELWLHFQDNGDGIDDDVLPHIFDNRYTTTNGGGIGLFHTKEIIEKMKWGIEVNNKMKRGVEFIVRITK